MSPLPHPKTTTTGMAVFSVGFSSITNLHGAQINDLSWRKHLSHPFLPGAPQYPLSQSWTFEGPFELTRDPQPLRFIIDLQRYKVTIWCDAPGVEVPGHPKEKRTRCFVVRLLRTDLFFLFQKSAGGPLAPFPTPLSIKHHFMAVSGEKKASH